MVKKVTTFFLVLALITFTLSSYIMITIHPFNHTAVKNNIKYLSSDYFKGRLPGTVENTEVSYYVKEQMIANNLKPLAGSYFQSFKVKYPSKISGSPYLKVVDKKGNLIKEFTYGKEYVEDMVNFKSNKMLFNKSNKLYMDSESLHINQNGNYFVFYTPSKGTISFRSSFTADSPCSMGIIVTKDALASLEDYITKSYTVECFIPYEVKEASVNNVVGVIKGKKTSLPPLIISAHFDHVGTSFNDTVYNGALDNASGISFVLELSKYLNSLKKPDRDIIVVGFNAEEFGLLGSKYFVEQYKNKLAGSKVYNFDMIGSNNSVPLCIMVSEKDSNKSTFVRSIDSTCTKQKIKYDYMYEDASDHTYFRKENIDAMTFTDKDMTRIHTPNDKAEFINTNSIDRCFNVVSKEIMKNAYINSPYYLYYKQALVISSVIIVISVVINIILARRKKLQLSS